MKNFFITSLLLLSSLFIFGCAKNDAQIEFEQQAYSDPVNFTETNHRGEIIDTDKNDWKISPLFQGLVEVNPPFPNPVSTIDYIQFEIWVTGVQSVEGLEILVRFDDGDPTSGFKTLYYETNSIDGLASFRINPLELGRINVPESARGLHRIFIFDGNQQMISYGDVMVE